ncbi:MAG TPA: hypothetical protein VEV83_22280, partial [Parafilimonas sp.]|nr:hypothetical protein [Parafilimonas sp.]
LVMSNGKRVKDTTDWYAVQRPYIYHLFEQNVYGRYPTQPVTVHFKIRESSNNALNGVATRKQVRVYLHPTDTTVFTDVLIYLPNLYKTSAPIFLSLNFNGNETVNKDPAILPSQKETEINRAHTDSMRGSDRYWQIEDLIARGYGVATAYYGDIEPDNKDGWKTGIRTTLKDVLKIQPEEWSALGAWAWGMSRIMDYIEQDPSIDRNRVVLMGHSRLGKASLWAGASDPRFAIVISNESGEGGAALSKRWFGETIKQINDQFPHWFVAAYKKYNDNADSLPVDQHMLLALIAPRPLYVASAAGDLWADPKGEFLSAVHAGEVYALFGKKGLGTDTMPAVDQPVGNTIRYHIRSGGHAVTLYDWQQYLAFADMQWK